MSKHKSGEPQLITLHPRKRKKSAFEESEIKIFEVQPNLFAAIKTVAGYGATPVEAIANLAKRRIVQ